MQEQEQNVGTTPVTVKFAYKAGAYKNYELPEDITDLGITILPAPTSVSKDVFETTFTYNGKPQTVKLKRRCSITRRNYCCRLWNIKKRCRNNNRNNSKIWLC